MGETETEDTIDGCDLDFTEDADDDETAALRALFPDGVAHDGWEGVTFDAAPS